MNAHDIGAFEQACAVLRQPRHLLRWLRRCMFLVFVATSAAAFSAEDRVDPVELRTYSTVYSIGLEWDIEGDANHNARCFVKYRVVGTDEWKPALPLLRVDYRGWWLNNLQADRHYNMLAGSILFLAPATDYELSLELVDLDGGSVTRTTTVTTRALPSIPGEGRMLHVVPGNGPEGMGTADSPLRGLAAAEQAAQPGDILILHEGDYRHYRFAKSGLPGRYIVWKAAGDGPVRFTGAELEASHIWLEGLSFVRDDRPNAFVARGECKDVVVSRNQFHGFHYSITLSPACEGWYIADNTIVGDKTDPLSRSQNNAISGEGIELNHSSGHVVAHNRISRVADGISYPHRNCDIFGNDIFDCSDDGVEPDYGYANIRIWGNRITNINNYAISFQPMYCGPWYFIRNQIITASGVFKFNIQDSFVLANNTFISWRGIRREYMQAMLRTISRNNLYISCDSAPIWQATPHRGLPRAEEREIFSPNWQTDVDYDGFDWGDSPVAFVWKGRRYSDCKQFARAVGIEQHGRRVRKEDIFQQWPFPISPSRVEPLTLVLRPGSAAVDAGVPLPNIVDRYHGAAPDLGAYELGDPEPQYGPR